MAQLKSYQSNRKSKPSDTLTDSSQNSPELVPTDEQSHILNLIHTTGRNIIINALAGSGKTSTLELIQAAIDPPVLCLAFNTRIAKTMRDRFLDTTSVRTFNSLGHTTWQECCSNRLVVNDRKNSDLLREAIYALPKSVRSEAFSEFFEITAAVALGKSLGYIPDGKFPDRKRLCDWPTLESRLDTKLSDLGQELVDEVLVTSIKASYGGSIDYNDQIYMPALFGGTLPNFPNVLVDEDQDLNPCNHALLKRLKRSRITAVGDDGQSIYAFRGAVPGGVAKLKEMFNMIEADLTVSFRCPENIVRNVHWHRPQMKWIKPGGHVERLENPDPSLFPDNATIICRNNAPLYRLALHLLACGRSVRVGGTDIGPKVVGIMRKFGEESMTQKELLSSINGWLEDKLSKESTTAHDIAECMRIFARQGANLGQAIRYAEHLFAQEGTIQLLTGHKSKGLEWDTVYHLDPWLIGEDEQERNLRYVISTRAKQELYEIDSREMKWHTGQH